MSFLRVEIESRVKANVMCGLPHFRKASKLNRPTRPTQPFFGKPAQSGKLSVAVIASVVVIATGEFDEHTRLIAHGPRIVARWQQHDIVL